MNKKVRLVLSIVLAVAAIVCIVCAIVFSKNDKKANTSSTESSTITTTIKTGTADTTIVNTSKTTKEGEEESTVSQTEETTKAPSNNDNKTTKKNPDTKKTKEPDVNDDIVITKATKKETDSGSKTPANSYPSTMGKQSGDNAKHLSVHMGSVKCKKGDRIAVPMYFTTNPGVWGIALDGKFNSSVLKYVDMEKGPAFNFLSIMKVDRPFLQATNGPLEDFNTTGLVAIYYFDVVGTGDANLEFYYTSPGNIINVNGDEIPIDIYQGKIIAS